MITTQIEITPYLAEYIYGKYNNGDSDEPVSIPDSEDLYHIIWDYMVKRPVNVSPIDKGNLILKLPSRRIGKDPAVYNYLSARAVHGIELNIRACSIRSFIPSCLRTTGLVTCLTTSMWYIVSSVSIASSPFQRMHCLKTIIAIGKTSVNGRNVVNAVKS